METVKRSVVARGQRERNDEYAFLGQWNSSVWYYNDETHVSIHLSKPIDYIQHQE